MLKSKVKSNFFLKIIIIIIIPFPLFFFQLCSQKCLQQTVVIYCVLTRSAKGPQQDFCSHFPVGLFCSLQLSCANPSCRDLWPLAGRDFT